MKSHVETAISRFQVAVLAHSGAVVSTLEFSTLRVLLSWLDGWHVAATADGQLVAPYPRYSPLLRPFMENARADGGLRINVYVASAHVSAHQALDLIAQRPPGLAAVAPFRDGPVKGTGKRRPYRFFRRHIRTADSHREGFYPADECDDVPPLRAARNRTNLPSGRDDIARCRTRSWKATRRHQWRDVRDQR